MKSQKAGIEISALIVRSLFALSLILVMLVASSTVISAITLDGSSRSYLRSEQSISENNLLPGYEYLDLSLGDVGNENISIHFGGWGRFDFKQETGETDLQYAFVSYKYRYDNAFVNLGRVMVFEGVAAERLDGGYARTDLAGNFGVSLFGGVPAETSINAPGNNVLYGARLSHQSAGLYRIGISALRQERDDGDVREDAGVDIWLQPANRVEVTGLSVYDSIDDSWKEHAYSLVLGPFDKIRLITDASWYDYSSFFRPASTAAFTFTTGLLDPAETAWHLGEEIQYSLSDKINVFANYRIYRYEKAGDASSYGGRVNYAHGEGTAAGLSVNRADGDTDRLKYTQYRLYGAAMMGTTQIAVDLIDLAFDNSDDSYSATLALAYNVTPSLILAGDAEYLTSPTFERDVRLLARIIYRFGFKTGGGA